MIEESSAYRYEAIINKLLAGEDFNIEAKSSFPYRINSNAQVTPNGNLLVIDMQGPIMKYDFCGSLGTASMRDFLIKAQNDNSIDGILLNIDSPGGAVAGTEEFATAIKNSTKPVLTYAHSCMASAAYWIGSSATEIIMSSSTTMLGSIGTMSRFNKTGNEGVVSVYASKSIRKNKIFDDAEKGEPKGLIEKVLNPLNAAFINAVASNRVNKINVDKEDVMEGDIYVGESAVNVGLADKIDSFENAVKRLQQLAKTIN